MRLRAGDITVDLGAMSLDRGGTRVRVEPLVLRLIAYLIHHRNRVVPKEELIDALWEGRAVTDSALTRAVSLARSALRAPGQGNPIRSVYGTGYQLAERRCNVEDGPQAHQRVEAQAIGGHPFVGRATELRAVVESLELAMRGAGTLHLVSGEPGIGKTRLLERLLEEGKRRTYRLWLGRCSDSDGAPAFWPWIQVLRQELHDGGEPGGPDLDESLRSRLEDLLWLGGDKARTSGALSSQKDSGNRFVLLDGLSRFLIARARVEPTLLVLDDIHQADQESLGLLRLLAFEIRRLPIVVVVAYRAAEIRSNRKRAAALAQIASCSDAIRHQLAGFSLEEVSDVLRSRNEEPGRAAKLRSLSGGNPLFLHHLISLPGTADMESLGPGEGLPDLLREAIERHLEHLSPKTQRVLSTAAAIGPEFDIPLLRSISQEDDGVRVAIEDAYRGGVLVPDLLLGEERWQFAHVLIRDGLYERTPVLERAGHHSRIAAALEQSSSERLLPRIAHHRRAAVAVDGAGPAIEATLRAAEIAATRFAYHEAASLYEKAAALLDTTEGSRLSVGECYLRLAEALVRAGDRNGAWRACDRAVDIARELNRSELLARAALVISPGVLSIETSLFDQKHVDLLAEAISANSGGPVGIQVKLLSRLTSALYWSDQHERRQRLSQDAFKLARHSGDLESLADALYARHSALWGPDSLKTRLEIARRLVAIATELGDAEAQLIYHSTLITDLAETGDTAAMEDQITLFYLGAARVRQPESIWLAPMFQGTLKLLRGKFGAAEALNVELLDLGTRVESEDAANCWAAQTVLRRFELGEGAAVIDSLLSHAAEHPNVLDLFRTAPAWAAAELGLVDQARQFLGHYSESEFQSIPRDMNWLGSLVVLSMASSELCDMGACRRLLSLLEPYQNRFAFLGYCAVGFGSVAAHLGRLAAVVGRTSEAWHYFELGHEANSAAGAQPWVARCHYGRGLAELAEGMRDRASRSLSQAQSISERLGMHHLSSRCETAMRSAS